MISPTATRRISLATVSPAFIASNIFALIASTSMGGTLPAAGGAVNGGARMGSTPRAVLS